MSKGGARDGEGERGLPRLPPGRHGLDRDFVVRNQRDRLTAGIIAVVAEQGYQDATVTKICAAGGVSRRTFYSYFGSKQDCYLAAFDQLIDFLLATIEEAAAADLAWPQKVRARIAALLGSFAANPALVNFALLAPHQAGEELALHHAQALERVLEGLIAGSESQPGLRRPSAAVEQALLGGMVALIVEHVTEDRGGGLPDLLPDLVELFLTPYLGRAQAARAGSSPTL